MRGFICVSFLMIAASGSHVMGLTLNAIDTGSSLEARNSPVGSGSGQSTAMNHPTMNDAPSDLLNSLPSYCYDRDIGLVDASSYGEMPGSPAKPGLRLRIRASPPISPGKDDPKQRSDGENPPSQAEDVKLRRMFSRMCKKYLATKTKHCSFKIGQGAGECKQWVEKTAQICKAGYDRATESVVEVCTPVGSFMKDCRGKVGPMLASCKNAGIATVGACKDAVVSCGKKIGNEWQHACSVAKSCRTKVKTSRVTVVKKLLNWMEQQINKAEAEMTRLGGQASAATPAQNAALENNKALGSPKLTPGSPKLAPGSPKLAPESPKLAPGSPKLAPGSPKLASDDSPKLASGSPKLESARH